MRRHKLGRKHSRKMFKRASGVNKRNFGAHHVMRGGIRF